MKYLATTEWLQENLENVKILDATWHLPNSNKHALEDYNISHIKNSIFFDLEKYSNQNSALPHMLPSKLDWEKIVSDLGISNSDHIVIYDNSDVFSSCRVWYTFLYFGHNTKLVSVLDGNFTKWTTENRPVSREIIKLNRTNYKAKENVSMLVNKDKIHKNIFSNKFHLIDARSKDRFLGIKPEPRKGFKSGHIKGSKNLPFQLLLNDDRTLKKKDELLRIFQTNEVAIDKDIVFTCGSGVTACILGLANSIINDKKPTIYDGSWAEYGLE